MTNLPDYVTFKHFPGMPLHHIFSAAGDDLLELLQGLFIFNPSTRLTATQVCISHSHLKTHYKTCMYLLLALLDPTLIIFKLSNVFCPHR